MGLFSVNLLSGLLRTIYYNTRLPMPLKVTPAHHDTRPLVCQSEHLHSFTLTPTCTDDGLSLYTPEPGHTLVPRHTLALRTPLSPRIPVYLGSSCLEYLYLCAPDIPVYLLTVISAYIGYSTPRLVSLTNVGRRFLKLAMSFS